jgi:hypothetical protein
MNRLHHMFSIVGSSSPAALGDDLLVLGKLLGRPRLREGHLCMHEAGSFLSL